MTNNAGIDKVFSGKLRNLRVRIGTKTQKIEKQGRVEERKKKNYKGENLLYFLCFSNVSNRFAFRRNVVAEKVHISIQEPICAKDF